MDLVHARTPNDRVERGLRPYVIPGINGMMTGEMNSTQLVPRVFKQKKKNSYLKDIDIPTYESK